MTTTCPDAGRLRAWLDREGPALDDHLTDCEACQTTLGALERDADHAARVLAAQTAPAPTAAETDLALARLLNEEHRHEHDLP